MSVHSGAASHLWFALLVALAFYFAPVIVAKVRNNPNVLAIGALNACLGWTLIGWVVALIWSLSNPQSPTVIVQTVVGTPPDRG